MGVGVSSWWKALDRHGKGLPPVQATPSFKGRTYLFFYCICIITHQHLGQCLAQLSAKSRPDQVSLWMKGRCYGDRDIPCVLNVEAYRKTWVEWWTSCQPSWRQDKGWPLPKVQAKKTTWGKLSAQGKNSLFLVIMLTTWWAPSLQSDDQRHFFKEVMDDIRWVIEQQLEIASTPNEPPIDENVPGTSMPGLASTQRWKTNCQTIALVVGGNFVISQQEPLAMAHTNHSLQSVHVLHVFLAIRINFSVSLS